MSEVSLLVLQAYNSPVMFLHLLQGLGVFPHLNLNLELWVSGCQWPQ